MQFLKIGNRRLGGFLCVHSLIYPHVSLQTKFISGGGYELPQSKGPRPGHGPDFEATFDEREPREFFGETGLLQRLDNLWPISSGSTIRGQEEFPFSPLK